MTTINAPGGSCSSDSLCPKHQVPLVHTITDGPPLCAVCERAGSIVRWARDHRDDIRDVVLSLAALSHDPLMLSRAIVAATVHPATAPADTGKEEG